MIELKKGARVKKSGVKETSIPAYRDMRGTVVGISYRGVEVQWDYDDLGDTTIERTQNIEVTYDSV